MQSYDLCWCSHLCSDQGDYVLNYSTASTVDYYPWLLIVVHRSCCLDPQHTSAMHMSNHGSTL